MNFRISKISMCLLIHYFVLYLYFMNMRFIIRKKEKEKLLLMWSMNLISRIRKQTFVYFDSRCDWVDQLHHELEFQVLFFSGTTKISFCSQIIPINYRMNIELSIDDIPNLTWSYINRVILAKIHLEIQRN